jgi:hypothetical protein
MSVVCKMQCHSLPAADDISEAVQPVRFGAVWVPDDEREEPENAIFGKATPWGEITLGIANPEAKKFFVQGAKYFVTFTKAD